MCSLPNISGHKQFICIGFKWFLLEHTSYWLAYIEIIAESRRENIEGGVWSSDQGEKREELKREKTKSVALGYVGRETLRGGSQNGCSRCVAPAWRHRSTVLVMVASVSVWFAIFCLKVHSLRCCQMLPSSRIIIVLMLFFCSGVASLIISAMISTAFFLCCQTVGCKVC